MALQKQITLDSGVTGEYLRIYATSYKAEGRICTIDLAFYKDQASRDANRTPITHTQYEVLDLEDISLSALYAFLKTLPEYTDAVDL